jgi:hypothetical protein
MLLSLVGFFYPGNEGGLYVACIVLYAVTASIAGYVSTTMYACLSQHHLKWEMMTGRGDTA